VTIVIRDNQQSEKYSTLATARDAAAEWIEALYADDESSEGE